MGWQDRVTNALGSVIGGALDIASESFEKANRRSDDPSNRANTSVAMTSAVGRSPLPPEPAQEDPKGLLYDPFALIDQLGFRDRPTGLTYMTLRQMAKKVPVYTAILQTRVNQVSSFGQRQKDKREAGFGIVLRDDKATPTKQDRFRMQQLEDWLLQTGTAWAPGRDDFRTFLRKITRDSLVLDQCCHPAGTMIELADGTQKPIELIQVSDSVRTHSGRVRPVVELMRRNYDGRLYTLRSGGISLTATDNHPLLVVDDAELRFNPQKPKWLPASDVKSGHYLVYPKFEVIEPARPREPYLQDDEYFYLPVSEVTEEVVEDFPVFNFEVAEDHSYIANGVVSHNCFEIVRNRKGQPAEFYAMDAGTVRIADVPMGGKQDPNQVRYVQVYDEVIISEFAAHEMCFGVRNPRTDIKANGYGFSDLEILINVVTASLWAFQYNQNFFKQGTAAKGVLNFKGSVPDKKIDAFRRQWQMMIAGVSNAHRTPMTNVDDVQWIDMHTDNQKMGYADWMDWLTKIICAVAQFDPAEINFNYGNSGQGGQMFATPVEAKLKNSKDRGLKPLLSDIAHWINVYLIWPQDPYFEFKFLGLDAKSTDQAVDLAKKRSEFIMTVDELRAEEDLPPLPDGAGEVILNPVWLQNKQATQMAEQMEEGEEVPENGKSPMAEDAPPDQDFDFEEIFNREEKSLPVSDELRKSAKVKIYEIEL